MDKAYWDSMRWEDAVTGEANFRWDVFDPKQDVILDRMKKREACHLGNCAPAVAASSTQKGARAAGTLTDGTFLHCRANVKIPMQDQILERMKK